MAPLRRKPKQLTAEPTLFETASGGGGGGPMSGTRGGVPPTGRQPGAGAVEFTDDAGTLLDRAPDPAEPDAEDELDRIRQRLSQLTLAEASAGSDLQVLAAAEPPCSPASPKPAPSRARRP